MRAVIVIAVLAALAAPVSAQPADAIGRPLPDASLKDGTVVVRLIAGDRAKPVSDAEVTLTVTSPTGDGAPLEKRARTDADGRGTFIEVPPASRVKISAPGVDGEVVATPFPMPETGGVRIMVSTIKAPAGAGAPMGAPGGPPMTPRAMSGQPRPEQGDDGDTLTVRLSYDDFSDATPPRDHPVVLVDYQWDQIVSSQVVRTDAGGRAVFRKLNRGGSHSYFALTMLPRGDGFDRLISYPVVMPGETGVRLMLSGDKRTIATPVDDLALLDPQPPGGVPGGEVRVNLLGAAQPGQPVELLDVGSGKVLATVKAGPPAPEGDGQQRAQASARFTGVTDGGLDRAFVVRSVTSQIYLSAPFQLTAGRGASVTLLVVPRVMLQFSLSSWIDDVYLGVRGTFSVQNASWAPYVAGTNEKPEELVIALPRGFKGATVRDDFAEAIGVDPTRGFVIRRPLPPGNTTFMAGFSIEYEDGELTWDMPLPLGSLESEMEINRNGTGDKMTLVVPGDVKGVSVRDGAAGESKFYILQPITILPGQRMVFKLDGLPRPPAWSRWAKIIAGLIVLTVLAVGTTFALTRAPAAPAAVGTRARFDQLVDELAALEQAGDGGDGKRRDQIMAELEVLHRKSGAG